MLFINVYKLPNMSSVSADGSEICPHDPDPEALQCLTTKVQT